MLLKVAQGAVKRIFPCPSPTVNPTAVCPSSPVSLHYPQALPAHSHTVLPGHLLLPCNTLCSAGSAHAQTESDTPASRSLSCIATSLLLPIGPRDEALPLDSRSCAPLSPNQLLLDSAMIFLFLSLFFFFFVHWDQYKYSFTSFLLANLSPSRLVPW